MAETYKARVQKFDEALAAEDINFDAIKSLAVGGVPEGEGRRALTWRILLNFLPLKRKEWPDFLAKQRQLYKDFIDEMLITPSETHEADDHPLSTNPQSQWQSFFKDNEVLLQIDKDVRRLCPEISFFSQPTKHPNEIIGENRMERLHQRVQNTRLNSQNLERKGLGMAKLSLTKKKNQEDYDPLENGQEAHWEVVQRILFLYAKLNPGQGYVQGMNEIIGPIYYVFASDPREDWRAHAEADCFFCFTNLMSDIRDFFIKTLDESETGINRIMQDLMSKLKTVDYMVHGRLMEQDIKPQFYLFRWLTLMLTQEFALPDVLRIWDSLLTDETRRALLTAVCVAMMVLVREEILQNEFPDNMKLLQNYPPMDVQRILSTAGRLM